MQPQELRHRLSFSALKAVKYAMSRHDLEFESKGSETFDRYRCEHVVTEHLKLFAGGDAELASVLAALMPDGGIEHLTAIVTEGFVSQMKTGLNPKGLEDWTTSPDGG
jgi:hypothetical protein